MSALPAWSPPPKGSSASDGGAPTCATAKPSPQTGNMFACPMAEETIGGDDAFECKRCGLHLAPWEKNEDDKTQKDICD
eukprot:1633697-Pyramimonas_sp.AAC.1